MAGLNDNGHNAQLAGLAAVAVFASLHTADPGTTGTSEVTGGTPAYARKAITWGTPATSSMAMAEVLDHQRRIAEDDWLLGLTSDAEYAA